MRRKCSAAMSQRGPGQFTIGLRSAGPAHLETFEGLQAAVRDKLRQHAGLADPLVVVLGLSSPIIEDRDISAMLYGRTVTTMLDPLTPVTTTRDRAEGIWPDPVPRPPRPAAVLILRGIWLGSEGATAELWLLPGIASPPLPGPWRYGLSVQMISRLPSNRPAFRLPTTRSDAELAHRSPATSRATSLPSGRESRRSRPRAVRRTELIDALRSRAFRKLHRRSTATEGTGADSERNVSALMAKSLTWDRTAFARAPARHPRRRFENEAVAWQLRSQRGGCAAFRSYADQSAGRRARRKDPNRIVELHAMTGAIGAQAGLCWGFEQDAQRFGATRKKISEEHHRLVLRALSEAGGHFLFGAAHSPGNLGLRIALLEAGPAIQAARPKADFAPGSDDKRAWLSLSVSSEILANAASGSANMPLARISAAVSGLAASPRYVALDSRRGTDYHRLRPQPVPHASPKRGVSQTGDGLVTIDLPGPVLDPEAGADRVYHLLVEAMEAVRQAMVIIRK